MGFFSIEVLFRVFWGLFLGGILCVSLSRSWSAEHGKQRFTEKDDTVIWLNPALCIIYMGIFFGINLLVPNLFAGYSRNTIIRNCMETGSMYAQILIFVNVYFVFLLCFLPICRKFLYARTCAAMWLVPIFLFYQPGILLNMSVSPVFVLYIPGNVWKILFILWFAGFVLFFFGQIVLHFIWRRKLIADSEPVMDEKICSLLEREKQKLRLKAAVELRYSRRVKTPVSLGMFMRKKYTFLPDRVFSDEELVLIFRHELHHIQRKDMDTKFFLAFCRALGWFHPLIWIALRKAAQDLELSCDEIVLEQASKEEKENYARLLLSTAGYSVGFSTCLSASARTLRYRLRAVINSGRRKMGLLVLMLLMLVSILLFGSIGLSFERGTLDQLIFQDLVIENGQKVFVSYESENFSEKGYKNNGDEIISYLKSLEAEHLLTNQAGIRTESDSDFYLYFGHTIIQISGGQLLVTEGQDDGVVSNHMYRIRSEVDWTYLENLLE